MRITKCDICKKTIAPDTESLQLGYRSIKTFASFELCATCIKPITKILKNRKLIKIENKKDGKRK